MHSEVKRVITDLKEVGLKRTEFRVSMTTDKDMKDVLPVSIVIFKTVKKLLPLVPALLDKNYAVCINTNNEGKLEWVSVYTKYFIYCKPGKLTLYNSQQAHEAVESNFKTYRIVDCYTEVEDVNIFCDVYSKEEKL